MTMLFCLSRYFLDLESADQYGLFSKDGLLFTLHLYSWYLNPLNQLDIQIHNNKLNEYPVQMHAALCTYSFMGSDKSIF